jgi:hypothetical protein
MPPGDDGDDDREQHDRGEPAAADGQVVGGHVDTVPGQPSRVGDDGEPIVQLLLHRAGPRHRAGPVRTGAGRLDDQVDELVRDDDRPDVVAVQMRLHLG